MAKFYRKWQARLKRPIRVVFLPLSVLVVGYFALPAIVSLWDEIFSSLLLFELVIAGPPLRL